LSLKNKSHSGIFPAKRRYFVPHKKWGKEDASCFLIKRDPSLRMNRGCPENKRVSRLFFGIAYGAPLSPSRIQTLSCS
jgi:hypothetical protein